MNAPVLKRVAAIALALLFALPTTLLADSKDNKPTATKPDDKTAASQADASAPKGKLSEEENPLLIGKRNINKHQIDFYSLNKEVALGRQLAADVDRQGKFIDDPVVTEYVNRVGQNLALHSDAKIPFTIKVLDSDDVNAFALPGGFLYVNKGAILAADNEAELAGVMAHEIGHVAARHGVEQASKATIANYAFIPLIFLSGGLGAIAYQAYQIGVPLTFLKFTRGAEAEADRLGAQYLWAAGYDPNQFLTFFEKLEKKEKGKPGTLSKLFGTHPPTPDRITKVHDLLARFPDRDEYMVTTSDFNSVKSRLLAITNSKTLDANGNRQTGPQRPTLKRRKDADDQTQSTSSGEETPKEKPTLKRRDSDGKPPDNPNKPPQNP
ncbi:MAG TPA: M48 family metallopeptidase [Blastocatellia bacterium]|nr:M48 family metallopeptidase [Blastocatellia bacterium]